MANALILQQQPLDFHWPTLDPFLFCAHHHDQFPNGNGKLGPASSLQGRSIGQDFAYRDGWNMYHGNVIPGFPCHPHRGFETVTFVRQGFVDHVDSLGAAGRYGNGDVQWMTAGRGIQHAEMFPLLQEDNPNPLLLFQIWLNLPARGKMVAPHFKMLWSHQIPEFTIAGVTVTLVAGALDHQQAPTPAPDSWAADADHGVIIAAIDMEPGSDWLLSKTDKPVNRMLYFYQGTGAELNGELINHATGVQLNPALDLKLRYQLEQPTCGKFLLLQGQPIGEPVEKYGPFVMNTAAEIQTAFRDFQATQFGGWPWPSRDFVHPKTQTRFARYPDGTEEAP